MSLRVSHINDLYNAVQRDNDELALLLSALLYPQPSDADSDHARRRLLAVTAQMHDNLNLIVSKTLEHDRQRRNRIRKGAA